jgi:hypothetical protein
MQGSVSIEILGGTVLRRSRYVPVPLGGRPCQGCGQSVERSSHAAFAAGQAGVVALSPDTSSVLRPRQSRPACVAAPQATASVMLFLEADTPDLAEEEVA